MTDVNSTTCTGVTILFEGEDHSGAADAFIIQFSDGGLNEHFEGMFNNIQRNMNINTSEFDTAKRTLTLRFDK